MALECLVVDPKPRSLNPRCASWERGQLWSLGVYMADELLCVLSLLPMGTLHSPGALREIDEPGLNTVFYN